MTFKDLQLSAPILRAIEEKGYEIPTPIQQQAIGPVLAGRDLLGCAQTGTGKTAAFTLPILQLLDAQPRSKGRREIKALVLTPTRELAIQIDECCEEYAVHTDIRHNVIYGGVSQVPQVRELQRGIDMLVATPGRLLDLIGQGHITLKHVEFFVLDEADRMLDMGFIHDIRRILPMLPKEKQTLFFSATMPPSIAKLAESILRNPVQVHVTPPASVVDTIEQKIYFVEKAKKSALLVDILNGSDVGSVLIFSRTKHGADRIAKTLNKAGITARAIHGDKSQGARTTAMTEFKSGKCRVLVATDIAARGIDISELPLVINFDLPEVPETYVHRIGRTGRAGHEGVAYSFCSDEERDLLKDIQKTTGLVIPTAAQSGSDMQPVAFEKPEPKQTAPKSSRGEQGNSQRSGTHGNSQRSGSRGNQPARDGHSAHGNSRPQRKPKQFSRDNDRGSAPKTDGQQSGGQQGGNQPRTGRHSNSARTNDGARHAPRPSRHGQPSGNNQKR